MILKKTWSGRKRSTEKMRPQSIWDGVKMSQQSGRHFKALWWTVVFIFHHRVKFHFASRVTLKVEPAIEVWLARYRYDGWNRISALIWFRCQHFLKTFLCLIWYFVGRTASLYGCKFVLLVLYIGQVAVSMLSLSALCQWTRARSQISNWDQTRIFNEESGCF